MIIPGASQQLPERLARPGATLEGLHGSAPWQTALQLGLVLCPEPAPSSAGMLPQRPQPSVLQPAVNPSIIPDR